MTRDERLSSLLYLYRPRVSQGNYSGDVFARGRNDGLRQAILALDLCTEPELDEHVAAIDRQDWDRSEAMLARLNAEER